MRKTLFAFLTVAALAVSALADTVVLTIDLSTKEVTVADTISIRETVPVQIVNLGGSSAANLVLRFLDNDAVVYAQASNFVDVGSSIAYGTISLNTQELVDYFEDMAMQAQRAFTLGLWDVSLNRLLVNDVVTIQNNPYVPGMPGPNPLGVSYMAISTYDTDTNGVVDTSDALVALLDDPPWLTAGTNDGVQAGVATNAGASTWAAFPVAYTGTVSVVATPSDDFTYEASIRVQEPVATTGFYFTVSSAAGTVTNAWKVLWVASPDSATGATGAGSYTDADAVTAVSNVLGTAAWVNVGTGSNDVPTYADVEALTAASGLITNAYRVEFDIADSNTWDATTATRGTVELDSRMLAFKLPEAYGTRNGLTNTLAYPGGAFATGVRYYEIADDGVTGAKILDETITLADIADASESALIARAGDVESASNNTYSAGTTQALDAATANTVTIGTGSVTRLNVLAPELSEDGLFNDAASWTYDTNFWTLGFGALYYQASGTSAQTIYKDIGAIAGRTYTVTYDYYMQGVGVRFTANVGGTGGTPRLANGTYTDTIVAGTNGLLTFTVSPLLGGEVYALVWNVDVRDTNSEIVMTNGVINVGGRTVTWDKIALWDAAGAGTGTSTNSTHLGGVAAASYALGIDVTAAVTAHNTNASAHTALFALKQDAATAATDAELTAHTTNATAHASLFAATQPLDADLTTLAANNGGSLTNLQPFRTAWKLAYGNGSAQWTEIGLGTSGQYLRSAGPSAAPSWYTPSFTAIVTNMGIADLTNVFAASEFVVGDGTNLVATSLADTKTLLGVGWASAGTSNDIAAYDGAAWTNLAFLDVLNAVVADAGGWYSFGIDAQTIDGLDSSAFLVAASGIDDISDVDVATATSGQFLSFDGTNWVNADSTTDTNALEAMWQGDDTTATGTLYTTLSGEITAATGTLYTTLSGEITSATGTLYSTVSGDITTATGEVYTAAVAAYAAGDTTTSNALMDAFYVGYTNLSLAIAAGDTANSNDVTAKVASYLKHDGSTAMTGNLNMGGNSITNIAAASLGFVGGETISAAKVAAWDAVGTGTLATVASTYAAKSGDLTQLTNAGTSGQVFKSNGSGGGAWSADLTSTSVLSVVQAFASGEQTISASVGATWQILSWSDTIDVRSNFAGTQFTAPDTANYRFSLCVPAQLSDLNKSTAAYVRLRKNGTTALYTACASLTSVSPIAIINAPISFSVIVSLNAGDVVTVDAAASGNQWNVTYVLSTLQQRASLSIEQL